MVIIRNAVPADAAGIARVQKTTWRATYPNQAYGISDSDIRNKTEAWDSPAAITRLEQNIALVSSEFCRLVAISGEEIVGHCLVRRGDDQNELLALYVLPDSQAKGIGYQLARRALDWLGEEKSIVLDVARYNQPAIRFYENLGFAIEGDTENPVGRLPSGAIIPEYRMARRFPDTTESPAII